jgi:acetoin utilization deacetylase AcuC-like enzyme
MPPTAFLTASAYLEHDSGPGHPECPQRVSHAVQYLEAEGILGDTLNISPLAAPLEALEKVHTPEHIERIESLSQRGSLVAETPDTVVSPATYAAARLASGAVIQAVDAVMQNNASNAFCLHRPPGHHAERSQAMGFCYFNHIAVGARHLLEAHGLDRVAIVDWDVHHGNGTQHTFEDSAEVFFFSIHQAPHWPFTGASNEKGSGPGLNTTLNFPVSAGSGSTEYFTAFDDVLWPALEKFNPDFILLSAGFDAHRNDPLGNINLREADFSTLTDKIMHMSQSLCQGRLVSVFEGGYDWQATSASLSAHMKRLMD